jgi:hypothetical protein
VKRLRVAFAGTSESGVARLGVMCYNLYTLQ